MKEGEGAGENKEQGLRKGASKKQRRDRVFHEIYYYVLYITSIRENTKDTYHLPNKLR